MNWVFTAGVVAMAAWALWRAYEAYTFTRLVSGMQGELTEQKVQRFIDGLAGRSVPNSKPLWAQLDELGKRVDRAGGVSLKLKREFRVMLESKGIKL